MAVGGPTGADLASATTDGNTLATYGSWTEREITFTTAGLLKLSYAVTDATKQGAQSTLHSWYQSFIPAETFILDGLEINIDSVVSGTARATIYFYNADANGKPTGSPLGGGTLGSLSTGSTGWQGDLTLSGSVTLTAGNRYCFRLQGLISSGEYYFDFDSGDNYGNGTCWYWNGSDYVAQNGDIDFKLYGAGVGVELTSSVKYAIVVKAPDVVGSAELNWSTRIDNPYGSGDRYGSSNSGSSWSLDVDDDVWFKTKANGVEKEDGSFTQDGFNRAEAVYGVNWSAQTFIASSTYTISSVILKLSQYLDFGGSVETVTVSIRATEPDLPGIPTTPSPSDTASDITLDETPLSWVSGGNTDTYEIYFREQGDSWDLVGVAQAGVSWAVSFGTLAYGTTYEWRIDATNTVGTTTGDTWSFDTISFYQLRISYRLIGGGNGQGPYDDPPGVQGTDWEWTGENNMLTVRKLVVAANNKIWHEDI